MTVPRIDTLVGAPIVGRYYLVPCVLGEWYGQQREWPGFSLASCPIGPDGTIVCPLHGLRWHADSGRAAAP